MPDDDDDRSETTSRGPAAGTGQNARRALVAVLIGAILVLIVIATVSLH